MRSGLKRRVVSNMVFIRKFWTNVLMLLRLKLPCADTQRAKGAPVRSYWFIIVDKITHLSEIAGPSSAAFVVRNVRLTGTLGRYQVRKATYR